MKFKEDLSIWKSAFPVLRPLGSRKLISLSLPIVKGIYFQPAAGGGSYCPTVFYTNVLDLIDVLTLGIGDRVRRPNNSEFWIYDNEPSEVTALAIESTLIHYPDLCKEGMNISEYENIVNKFIDFPFQDLFYSYYDLYCVSVFLNVDKKSISSYKSHALQALDKESTFFSNTFASKGGIKWITDHIDRLESDRDYFDSLLEEKIKMYKLDKLKIGFLKG